MQPASCDWEVGVRVWIERAGRALLGKGRLQLLEGIDRWHSISEAARQMGMSYRRAWLLVQETNEAAGEALVTSAIGGSGGGGAALTDSGRRAVAVFRELCGEVERTAAATLPRLARRAESSLRVAAAISLEEVLGQLFADYAVMRPDASVRAVFGGSDALAGLLLHGAPADLVLTAGAPPLVPLQEAGVIVAGSHTAVAENRLAALARPGWKTSVRSPSDLASPAVRRLALADAACPLGTYARSYLKSLKLERALGPRVLPVDNSRAVIAALRAGAADIGLVYSSDLAAAHDCRLLFRVPGHGRAIRYWGAVAAQSPQPRQARELLDFLTSPRAASRFRRCGFRPLPHTPARRAQ